MSSIDAALLRGALADSSTAKIDDLDLFASIASTNSHLLAKTPPRSGRAHVALADQQTAGRGRQDRRWLSPPDAGLCLSMAYTFAARPDELSSLTLATGVGIVNALLELKVQGLRLKWPNDIVALDGKLGGVLTEVHSRGGASVTVVTGVGLNLALPEDFDAGVDSSWAQRPVDLRALLPTLPSRELVAATLINHLCLTMDVFADQGFEAFAGEWRQYDWLRGKAIAIDTSGRQVNGTAVGVDANGALLVDADGARMRVLSGSIVTAAPASAAQ